MEFEEWFDRALPRLLRLATALCGTPDEAQDLVQDVVIKVQQRWLKVSGLAYRDAYVRRMLVNEQLSFRRKFARIVLQGTVEPADYDDRPHFTDTHADRAVLLQAVRRLPPRQRAVIVLRYFDDADDGTIAQILGCRPSTVRSHATRALKRLRVSPLRGERLPATSGLRPAPRVTDGQEDPRAYRS